MNIVKETYALTAVNFRNIPQRIGNSLVIVIGMAGTVAVLMCVFSLAKGFRETVDSDGRADRAIVLARGADSESNSSLSPSAIATAIEAPQIKRDANGAPIVSAEVLLVAPVARKSDLSDVNVSLRGVGEKYFALRPELRLTEGRMFRPGTRELLVGEAARSQFLGMDIGSQVRLQDGDWNIVGVFSGGKGARESELIANVQTVMSAYKLNAFNSITVQLVSASSLDDFRNTLISDPTLFVEARSEPEYLLAASKTVNRMLQAVAYSIGSIMALGALFAALNSMHAVVAARSVEIATLRAIGFSPFAISAAVMIEALSLALLGAIVGLGIALLAFNGTTISTLGGAVWDSQLVYSLTITPSLAVIAICLACLLGLLGAAFPALMAARMNVADALRSS